MIPDCYLIVGICSDKDIEENKGSVVMNDEERVESVRHCKWVDEIHFPAPW
jgi:choline-phosphate cytidylyltransferase